MNFKKVISAIITLLLLVTPGVAVLFSGMGDASINTDGSAKMLGAGFIGVGVTARAEYDRRYIREYRSGEDLYNSVAITSQSTQFSVGFGVLSMLDLSVSMPIFWDHTGHYRLTNNSYGAGDLSVGTKISLTPPKWDRVISTVFLMNLQFPTGSSNEGLTYHSLNRTNKRVDDTDFFSSNSLVLNPNLIFSFDFSKGKTNRVPVLFSLNAGGLVATDDNLDNVATYGARLNIDIAEPLSVYTKIFGTVGASLLDGDLFPSIYSNRAGFGLIVSTPNGLSMSIGTDFGLGTQGDTLRTVKHGDATYKVQSGGRYGGELTISWSGAVTKNNYDDDSLRNQDDLCPHTPEDYDGYKDSDGCPELDNDNDGILDLNDKCPDDMEDRDGFEDSDGCPELDNDGDGIVDSLDKCSQEAEDINGYNDDDGCPEHDIDSDGIVNTRDQCPEQPEDFDGFMDRDGCPEFDNDSDGILDINDECPRKKENFNGVGDSDGCPDTVISKNIVEKELTPRGTVILHGVQFSSGSSTINEESKVYLDPILSELLAYPNLHIEIRGYTDSAGNYKSNVSLSYKRAEAVRQYLIQEGVGGERVVSKGFGPNNPIADNKEVSGRKKNRRIEVVKLR